MRRANVRLIAVNEGVDTGSGFDDDFLPFRDVINEYYAKQNENRQQNRQQTVSRTVSRTKRKKEEL